MIVCLLGRYLEEDFPRFRMQLPTKSTPNRFITIDESLKSLLKSSVGFFIGNLRRQKQDGTVHPSATQFHLL
jgi:hypothetical protein